MRQLSSTAHRCLTLRRHHRRVVVDEQLPAAVQLTGPGARDALDAVVSAAGGHLVGARPCYVHYRPGSMLVVRYDAMVAWTGGAPVAETLLAATGGHDRLEGALRIRADTEDGPLEVDVWRWPFDPVLVGLRRAVVASSVASLLGGDGRRSPMIEVVAYRPTERAVVRCRCADGAVRYLKVVPPDDLPPLVERHERLAAAGLPVPRVMSVAPDDGVLVMEALEGPTLREQVKADRRPWPGPGEYLRLTDSLARCDLADRPVVNSRVADAIGHAAMLSIVAPQCTTTLERLTDAFAPALQRARERAPVTIHGDLYEAQLVVDGAYFSGLLDIDGAGPGDPYADAATVLAHLRYRAAANPDRGTVVDGYADELRLGFADVLDADELDVVTAAALVGLATGPFRIQQHGWVGEIERHIATAEQLARTTDERSLSRPSRASHTGM